MTRKDHTRIFNHSSHFPLTVIAWSSVFVLRSISALGTPRKVFLPLFRATTPKDGLVLTIFTFAHDTLVSFNFIFITLGNDTCSCRSHITHSTSTRKHRFLLLAVRSMKIFHSSRRRLSSFPPKRFRNTDFERNLSAARLTTLPSPDTSSSSNCNKRRLISND